MEQIPTKSARSKYFASLLGVLTLVAIVAVAPHAFAQSQPTVGTGATLSPTYNTPAGQTSPSQAGQGQQNGIPLGSSYSASNIPPPSGSSAIMGGIQYTDSDNPHGPLQMVAWAAGIAIFGVMSGVGIWTAVRKH